MAFGFPFAYYEEDLYLVGDRTTARRTIVETLQTIGWKYEATAPDEFRIAFPLSGLTFGERLVISFLENGMLNVKSTSAFGIFDWGRNKAHVREFTSRFPIREIANTKIAFQKQEELNESASSPVERMLAEKENTDSRT